MQQSTKAQIQLAETIAVLIVFTIFLVFGLYWFSQSAGETVNQNQAQLENLELLEMTKAIMSLPEIQCSIAARPDTSCVDLERIRALNNRTQEDPETNEHYQDRYDTNTRGRYALEVIDVQTNTRYEIFNYTTNQAGASRQQQAIPVVLYDPVEARNNFSMLILTQEVDS